MAATTRSRRTAAVAPELVPGDPVALADGGDALVIGLADGYALLRCGSMHDSPHRVPVADLSKVDATERHDRFREEAQRRGELA